jgi:hypothetical protein
MQGKDLHQVKQSNSEEEGPRAIKVVVVNTGYRWYKVLGRFISIFRSNCLIISS